MTLRPTHGRVYTVGYSQLKDLFLIPALNTVSFGLTSVACNDSKVFTCNGEDGTTVGRVRIKSAAIRFKQHELQSELVFSQNRTLTVGQALCWDWSTSERGYSQSCVWVQYGPGRSCWLIVESVECLICMLTRRADLNHPCPHVRS